MRIDPDDCRDPELLAAEVRRLQAVIAAGEPTLTDEERAAIRYFAHFFPVCAAEIDAASAILRKLLERTK
jgi:hypothetical protein